MKIKERKDCIMVDYCYPVVDHKVKMLLHHQSHTHDSQFPFCNIPLVTLYERREFVYTKLFRQTLLFRASRIECL